METDGKVVKGNPAEAQADHFQVCPTSKIERLLLVTDGSIFSEGATREAIDFAKNAPASFT
jgi:hypothetical protein